MNQLIKELAEHAGFIRFSPEEDPHTPIDWSCDYSMELEKFAELIVRECMNVCDTTTQSTQPLHLVSLGYSQRIKEHFGVE